MNKEQGIMNDEGKGRRELDVACNQGPFTNGNNTFILQLLVKNVPALANDAVGKGRQIQYIAVLMMDTMKRLISCVFLLAITLYAAADVRLPAVIGSHMVLQQNTKVTLWGWCEPNEPVEVRVGWDTTTYRAKGNSGAQWSLEVRTPKAGGPFTVNIKGYNNLVLEDVLIGEVWLCSGQSNMEMNMRWGLPYDKEAAEATSKEIRFFYVPKKTAAYPQDDVQARWVVCSPEAVKSFSAVGYFFGKELNTTLHVPVGLLNASWGGTPAEVWTPAAVVNNDPVLKGAAGQLRPSNGWPVTAGAAYNAMIYPLRQFAIAGTLWYQGESNTGTWASYEPLLKGMIAAWRNDWKEDFPFYLVQIAPYDGYGNQNIAALLREQQSRIASYPNTGMVVIHDLVDNIHDIHPKLKKEVGQRLANYALADTYKLPGIAYKSPQYGGMKVEKDKIRVSFTGADKGLVSKGEEPAEFYIAGADKVFKPARAKIEGNTVVVWSPEVKQPVAVRFGFSNSAMPNLFSKEGLPVNTFRTDDWEVDTGANVKISK